MKKPAPSVIEAVEQSLADNAELLKRLAEPRSSDVFPCALCRKPFELFDEGNLCSACRGDAPRTDKPVPEGPSWREQAEHLSEMCGTTNTSDETDIRAIATALRDAYVEGRRSAQRTETALQDEGMFRWEALAPIRSAALSVGGHVLVVEGRDRGRVGMVLSWRAADDGFEWQVTFADGAQPWP